NFADLGGNRLRDRTVARILKRRGIFRAALISHMLGELGVQSPLQSCFQHPTEHSVLTGQRLAGIAFGADPLQRSSSLSLIRELLLIAPTLLTVSRSSCHDVPTLL